VKRGRDAASICCEGKKEENEEQAATRKKERRASSSERFVLEGLQVRFIKPTATWASDKRERKPPPKSDDRACLQKRKKGLACSSSGGEKGKSGCGLSFVLKEKRKGALFAPL